MTGYTADDWLRAGCTLCAARPGFPCVNRRTGMPLPQGRAHSVRVRLVKGQFSPLSAEEQVRWVPMRDLFTAGLSVGEIMTALSLALPDLGLAYAIRLVDGEAAAERYLAAGGRVRIGADGEPHVPVREGKRGA